MTDDNWLTDNGYIYFVCSWAWDFPGCVCVGASQSYRYLSILHRTASRTAKTLMRDDYDPE